VSLPPENFLSLLLSSGRANGGTCFLCDELSPIDPHPVEDDGELSCQATLAFFIPPLGELRRPAFQR